LSGCLVLLAWTGIPVLIWFATFALVIVSPDDGEKLIYGMLVVGATLTAIGSLAALLAAFNEDVICGLLCLMIPLYALHYLISRWDEQKRYVLIKLSGVILLLGAGLAWLLLGVIREDQQRRHFTMSTSTAKEKGVRSYSPRLHVVGWERSTPTQTAG